MYQGKDFDLEEFDPQNEMSEEPVPVTDLKISVVVEYNGQVFSGEIHNEESFTGDLRFAIKKGKDPIDVIACLADHGSNCLPTMLEVVRNSRLGQP